MPRKQSPYQNVLIECACGCGQLFPKFADYTVHGKLAARKYIHGHNTIKKIVTRHCDQCGKEIAVPAYKLERTEHHFCSSACSGKYRRNKITLTCACCGRSFQVLSHRKDTAEYCSRQCQREGKQVVTKCNYCGNELVRPRSQAQGNCYCNLGCQHKWLAANFCGDVHPLWEGGHKGYRGKQWQWQRKVILARDGHKCAVCGSEKKLCVHHIKKYKEFNSPEEANTFDNLITLCGSCHPRVERGKLSLPNRD